MDVDMGYAHGSEESRDESEEKSHQFAQGSSDDASGGSLVHDKFDEFANAYNDESPPNWQDDIRPHGASGYDDDDDHSKDGGLSFLSLP